MLWYPTAFAAAKGRTGAGEGIEYETFTQRKGGANDAAQELLWFQ
jgi:hypothetical protein